MGPSDPGCAARRSAGLRAGIVAVLASCGPVFAAVKVEFTPQTELRFFRTGNVGIVGPGGQSDTVTQLRFRVSLRGDERSGSYQVSYAPYREIHLDSSTYDNTAHLLTAGWSRKLSPRSQFSLSADASRSQSQGVAPESADQATTFVPRTTIGRYGLRLGGRVQTGPRSFVSWDSGGNVVHRERPPCPDPPDPLRPCVVLEDSLSLQGGLAWGHEVARGVTLGVRYGYQDISFDVRRGTRTHTLQLQASRSFGTRMTGDLHAGVSRSQTGDVTRIRPSVNATLTRALTERMSFSLGARESISAGSGISSATVDRGAYASWQHGTLRGLVSTGITAGYWQRKSVLAGEPLDTRTLTTAEDLGFRVGRQFQLGIVHSYSKQSASGTATGLATSHHSGGIFARWSPQPR